MESIQNVVHLMMENRAFDTIFGYVDHNPNIDNLIGKKFCNPINFETNYPQICTSFGQPDIGPHNPDHEMHQVKTQIYGNSTTPNMMGFAYQASIGAFKGDSLETISQIMQSFDPADIPIHQTLAKEYTICDRWFSSVPGPTQPNRAFVHSATSHGLFENDLQTMLKGLPQRTIFQDILDKGLSWKSYFQEIPSLAIMGSIRSEMLTRTSMMKEFYNDAKAGRLANYSFLEPFYGEVPGHHGYSNDGHAGGESFRRAELLLKSVYEAVRNGPQWNNTLLIISYDEHGGFFDHVPPPRAPSPDGIVGHDKQRGIRYTFEQLGVRLPIIFVSPWVKRGHVIHEPKGPFPDSQFEHSSIPATLRKLFKLDPKPLTRREEWAGIFDEIFGKFRSDTPNTLPKVTTPWIFPIEPIITYVLYLPEVILFCFMLYMLTLRNAKTYQRIMECESIQRV